MMRTRSLFPDSAESEPVPAFNRTAASQAAAVSARSFVRSQVVRVHAFIESKGDEGATDAEIQSALKIDGNSQRPRRVWLRDREFIRAKGSPDRPVLRNGSTVWIAVRCLEEN